MLIGIQIAKDYDLFRVIAPDGTGSEPTEVGRLSVVTDKSGITYGAVVEEVDDKNPRVYRLAQATCQIEYVADFRDKDGNILELEDDEEDGDEDDGEDLDEGEEGDEEEDGEEGEDEGEDDGEEGDEGEGDGESEDA